VSDNHGGGGGSSDSFVMDAGDFITQIEVRSGDWIDQLQFLTSASKLNLGVWMRESWRERQILITLR
jgi:hypothetical protein